MQIASVSVCFKNNTTTILSSLTSCMVIEMMMFAKDVAVMKKMV